MHTLKLQYLIVLLNTYTYISKPYRERLKHTCKMMFNVHTLECFVTVAALLGLLVWATLLGFDIMTMGPSAGGSVIGGATLVLTSWVGLPWCVLMRIGLWRWVMREMTDGGVL